MTQQTPENTLMFDQSFQPQGRVGHLVLKVGAYWTFKNSQLPNEDDDLTMFRIVRERAFYKKWATILAWTFLITLLALAVVGA